MKAASPFTNMATKRLLESAASYAAAQHRLCGATTEDMTWWHHFAIATLIEELAKRLEIADRIIEIMKGKEDDKE